MGEYAAACNNSGTPLAKTPLVLVDCSNHLYFVASNVKNSQIYLLCITYSIRTKEHGGFKRWVDENVSLVAFVIIVAIAEYAAKKLENHYQKHIKVWSWSGVAAPRLTNSIQKLREARLRAEEYKTTQNV